MGRWVARRKPGACRCPGTRPYVPPPAALDGVTRRRPALSASRATPLCNTRTGASPTPPAWRPAGTPMPALWGGGKRARGERRTPVLNVETSYPEWLQLRTSEKGKRVDGEGKGGGGNGAARRPARPCVFSGYGCHVPLPPHLGANPVSPAVHLASHATLRGAWSPRFSVTPVSATALARPLRGGLPQPLRTNCTHS